VSLPDASALALEVRLEPKDQWRKLVEARIDKAVDDQGRALVATAVGASAEPDDAKLALRKLALTRSGNSVEQPARTPPGYVTFRLKGDEPAKTLAELKGTITAEVLTPRALITVDNVLQAVGKTVKGAEGGSIEVLEATEKDGRVELRIRMQTPRDAVAARLTPEPAASARNATASSALVSTRGAPSTRLKYNYSRGTTDPRGLALVDANGQHLPLERIASKVVGDKEEFALTFVTEAGQAASARLVFFGGRVVTVEIPFALKEMPLP
jgi:hypothetical protein